MATTANGVPYPSGPSALATWAATMLALAQFVDDRLNTRCKVFAGAAQTLGTGVAAMVAMNSEDTDAKGLHNPAANNTRITAAVAGRYEVKGQVTFAANAAGYRTAAIVKGGVTAYGATRLQAAGTLPAIVNVSASVFLAVGEYVELQAAQLSGGNLDTIAGLGNTWLDATLTGAV